MRPRIYKSTNNRLAEKQAFYREAIAAGFDKAHGGVPAYRAALAAGTVTRPVREHYNAGWYGTGKNAKPAHNAKVTTTPTTNPWAPFNSKAAWTRNQHEADAVEEWKNKVTTTPTNDPLTIDGFTKAQMRELLVVLEGMTSPWGLGVTVKGNNLIFDSTETYQRIGKLLIEALDQRMKDADIRNKVDHCLLVWENKTPEGVAAKKQLAIANGIIKACQGASYNIVFGDVAIEGEDHPRTLQAWKERYDDAKTEAMYAAMDKLMQDHPPSDDRRHQRLTPDEARQEGRITHERNQGYYSWCGKNVGTKDEPFGNFYTNVEGTEPTCKRCLAAKQRAMVTDEQPVKLWGITMTPAQAEAIKVRDHEKIKRQSARWAKARATHLLKNHSITLCRRFTGLAPKDDVSHSKVPIAPEGTEPTCKECLKRKLAEERSVRALEEFSARFEERLKDKQKPTVTLDAVKAMAAAIYPSLGDTNE